MITGTYNLITKQLLAVHTQTGTYVLQKITACCWIKVQNASYLELINVNSERDKDR